MKIYAGNLSYEVTEEDLRTAFSQFGKVESAAIIKDRDTGRSKGFGFVEMSTNAEGQSAIEALNGKEFKGRNLNVNEARPIVKSHGGKGNFSGSKENFGGKRDFFSGGKGGYGGSKGGFGGNRGNRNGSRGGRGGDR